MTNQEFLYRYDNKIKFTMSIEEKEGRCIEQEATMEKEKLEKIVANHGRLVEVSQDR